MTQTPGQGLPWLTPLGRDAAAAAPKLCACGHQKEPGGVIHTVLEKKQAEKVQILDSGSVPAPAPTCLSP